MHIIFILSFLQVFVIYLHRDRNCEFKTMTCGANNRNFSGLSARGRKNNLECITIGLKMADKMAAPMTETPLKTIDVKKQCLICFTV